MALPKQPTLEEINQYFYLVDDQYLYWKPQERSSFSDTKTYKIWNTKYANQIAGHKNKRGILHTRVNQVSYRVDYIIYALYHQKISTQELYHKDGDLSNNHISNLMVHDHEVTRVVKSKKFGSNSISVEYITACFSLLSDGTLVWKKRPINHFRSVNACNSWNSRFADHACDSKSNKKKIVVLDGKYFAAHRIVWALHYNDWPRGIIDHIDGNPHNNRIDNLRDVMPQENSKNMKKHSTNTSGFSGLYFDKRKKRWVVQIMHSGGTKYFGSYKDKEEAIEARHKAYKQLGFTERHGI
jgi:hypothetical protein